jgi:hypothetical protein
VCLFSNGGSNDFKTGYGNSIKGENVEFEWQDTFYIIRHFDTAGNLISTAYFGFDGCSHVPKGVVFKEAQIQ